MNTNQQSAARLLCSAFAVGVSVSLLSVTVDRDGVHVATRIAMADDGGESEGHDGDGSRSDHDSGDHSDHDRGDHSDRDSGDHSDRDGRQDSSRDGDDGNGEVKREDDNAAHAATEPRGTSGAKVEANGHTIDVVHPSGISEKINSGRYEMTDAMGRQIVERAATAIDFARLANTVQRPETAPW